MRTRRTVTRLALLATLSLLAVACNGPWGSPHGQPNQSGFNASERTIGVGNVATLQEKNSWRGASYLSPAIDNDKLYVTEFTQLSAYRAGVAPNSRLWWGTLPTPIASAPVAADGRVFVVSRQRSSSDEPAQGELRVYDATRTSWCGDSMSPVACPPLWQAPVGNDFSSPTVVGNVVYVVGQSPGFKGLHAYDARGSTGCSGVPKVCTPLWTSPSLSSVATPAVVDGRVFVSTLEGPVLVFDAAGVEGCAGTPKVCQPLFSTTGVMNSNFIAVVDGRIVRFNAGTSQLVVYDASGSQNCTGAPAVCSPLWSASPNSLGLFAQPAVAYGNVYFPGAQGIHVFDLAGVQGCGGVPKTCTAQRIITLPTDPDNPFLTPQSSLSSVSIANGLGFIGNDLGDVAAFDARSETGCTGTPLRCPTLWQTNLGPSRVITTPAVANGAVYVGTADGWMHRLAPSA